MLVVWALFVHSLQAAIFSLSQCYGGSLGAAIVSFSLLSRLALLPVTLPVQRRSSLRAAALNAIRPELLRLRERWRRDSQRLARATTELYRLHGLRAVDPSLLLGSLVQAPLFMGLFQAIRGVLATSGMGRSFLWIKSLASTDLALAVIVAGLVGAGAVAGGRPSGGVWAVVLPMAITLAMLLKASAGFGLYLGANAVVTSLQGLLLRRAAASPPRREIA